MGAPARAASRRALALAAALLGLAGSAAAQQAAHGARMPPDSARTLADSVAALEPAIGRGRGVYHGAGTCFACHGGKLEGSAIAPTLRAHKWRNGDGGLADILRIVTNGVPGTAMVAHPGNISANAIRDVATYVWAVSRGAAPP